MVWVWSDQRSFRSRRSDQSLFSLDHDPISDFGLIRGQFGLDGPILVFLVGTMVWVRCDQRSFRSRRSDHSLFSLDHGLGSVWLVLFWGMLALPRGNNKAAFRSDTSKVRWPWSERRSPTDSKCRSPQEEVLINWRPRRFLWKAV